MSWGGRAVAVAAGALVAQAVLAAVRAGTRDRPAWSRGNFRGATVSLAGGPALATAASLGAAAGAGTPATAAAALTAGLGAGAVGLYDDLVGARPEHRAKGFHGHLAALRQGRVTSGVVKIAGVGAAALAAAALLEARPTTTIIPRRSWTSGATSHPPPRPAPLTRSTNSMINTVLGAGVIAGAANLLNLLDLRPGRALKVGMLVGAPLAIGRGAGGITGSPGSGSGRGAGGLAAGALGAAAGVLPADLAEQSMLGDCGANALGALLGTALADRTGPAGRAVALAVIAALTAASERVSFTQVIANHPVLRRIDELGRAGG